MYIAIVPHDIMNLTWSYILISDTPVFNYYNFLAIENLNLAYSLFVSGFQNQYFRRYFSMLLKVQQEYFSGFHGLNY